MEIISLGHSSFKLIGKEVSVVCDPYKNNSVGLTFPKTDANVVTVSHNHDDHNAIESVRGDFICFDSPGEYEIKNIEIVGINSFHDQSSGSERGLNTIFRFKIDGISICHLGDLGQELSSDQLEKIDGIDILMIPVGGKDVLDPKRATKAIAEIGPKIVIPMHYKEGSLNDFEPVETFIKEIGKEPKRVERLKIQKKEIPENLEVYIIKK